MKLEALTWPQAKAYFERKNIVVISVGSIENHGTHLCLGTDYLVPGKLIDMIDSRLDVLFAPVMPFGNADAHMAYSGTISLGEEGLYTVMKAVAESLYKHGARRFVFLNGHGGNTNAISRVGLELNKNGAISAILNWWQIAPAINKDWLGGHGGAQETSAIMAIDEGYVDMAAVKDAQMKGLSDNLTTEVLGSVIFKGITIPVPRATEKITPAGWSGPDHPSTACIKWGNEMLEATADFIVEFINEFENCEL